jgi:hypothetical protein
MQYIHKQIKLPANPLIIATPSIWQVAWFYFTFDPGMPIEAYWDTVKWIKATGL